MSKDDPLKQLETANAHYLAEIGRLQAQVGELEGERARLGAELQQRRGVRFAAGNLYRAVDDAIIARIDRRGFIRKSPKRVVTPIDEKVLTGNAAALNKTARRYDAGAYFRYNASRSGMRLPYRVASKTYRILRDTAKHGLKGGYRLVRKGAK